MKRLIALSDGLWTSTAVPVDSNLGIIARALQTVPDDGTPQISVTDPFQVVARVMECGRRVDLLQESICALYQQLALNYSAGDTLWFFGFGRGSFIVRRCIGMIRNVGLLHRQHLDKLADAWHIYQTSWGADAQNAVLFRNAYCKQTSIRFLGVFDTLGELGIPPPLNGYPSTAVPLFHDTQLSQSVEFACHALAIDESRKGFQPCLWRTRPDRSQTEQCWFTGNHRDMGGIQGDMALANIPLRWMMSRACALGLAVDHRFLQDALAQRCREKPEESHNGRVGRSGAKLTPRLRPIGVTNGDETLHPSAEQRFLHNADYRPANLKAYIQRDNQIQLPL